MPVAIPIAAEVIIAGAELTGVAAAMVAISAVVLTGIVSAQQADQEARRRAEANRRNLFQMIRSAEAPHQTVYGQARVSGPIVFAHSTDENNGNLWIVIPITGHPINRFIEVVFNEVNIGAVSGAVLNGSTFFSQSLRLFEHTIEGESGPIPIIDTVGEAIVNLDANLQFNIPTIGTLASIIVVRNAIEQTSPDGTDFFGGVELGFANVGSLVTVTQEHAFVGMQVKVQWTEWVGVALVNVATYLGTTTQLADGDLIAAANGKWTTAHRLLGRAYMRARLTWNQEKFQSGLPNISGRIEGALVQDPRTVVDVVRDWNDNLVTLQTLFGPSGVSQSATSNKFNLTSTSANHALSRIDFASAFLNGSIEVTFTAPASGQCGFCFRTTNWADVEGSYNWLVYYVGSSDNVAIGKGTNSNSSPSLTSFANAASGVASGGSLTLKCVFNDGTFDIYVNGVLKLSYSSVLKMIAGQVGLYVGGAVAQTVVFDNLTILGDIMPAIYNNNSALCIRDYLLNHPFGLGCDITELDEESFIEAANISDEFIVVDPSTTSDPQKWIAVLSQGVEDGTWEQIASDLVNSFPNTTGLTLRNPGAMSINTSIFPGRNTLQVDSQSGSFSTYVTLDYLGTVANGSFQVGVGYPAITEGVGFCFRLSNTGAGDINDCYRVQIQVGIVRLLKFSGGSHFDAPGSPASWTSGTSGIATLKATFDAQNNLQVFVDGILKITWQDTVAPYTSGAIELLAFSNPPTIPNFFLDATFRDPEATIFRQRRYTCNGGFTVDRTHENILSSMLSSCAGSLIYTGGVYRLVVGAYRAPTMTFTENDLRGPIQIQPRKPREQLFNQVRGIFAGKSNFDQPTDFSPVSNPTYVGQDDGETLPTDIALEFTNDATASQRIAKIHLEKARQGISFTGKFKLRALALRPGDTFNFVVPGLGWNPKVFRVEEWSFACDEDYGIDITAQEDSPASYDWNLGNATVIDPAPDFTQIGGPQPQSDNDVFDDHASDQLIELEER